MVWMVTVTSRRHLLPVIPNLMAANNGSASGGAGSTNNITNSSDSGHTVDQYLNQTKKEDPYNSCRPHSSSR